MNKSVKFLLVSQFITAFADRALFFVLFVLIGSMEKSGALPGWYVPVVQASFILAYIFFAPFAGAFSDSQPKRRVLLKGNLIKIIGVAVLFLYLLPNYTQWVLLLGYFIVGIGAVIFSPAKYGLVPELVEEKQLVKINSWLEGMTIVAILVGQFAGAAMGKESVFYSIVGICALYALSTVLTFGIQLTPAHGLDKKHSYAEFINDFKVLLKNRLARFALLGVSLFWSVAAVLQVLLLEWAEHILQLNDERDIAILGIFTGVGIVLGSLIVPRLIQLETLRRTRFAAYGMGSLVVALSFVNTLYPAYVILTLIGVCGGMLVVPINAGLEDVGHQTIGSGGAVAVQRFTENCSMLTGLIIYTVILGAGVVSDKIMLGMGLVMIILAMIIALNLPKNNVVKYLHGEQQ